MAIGSSKTLSAYEDTGGVACATCVGLACSTGFLRINPLEVIGSSDFEVVADECANRDLQFGQCCTADVKFTPRVLGRQEANVRVSYTAIFGPFSIPQSRTIPVVGTGTANNISLELLPDKVTPLKTAGVHISEVTVTLRSMQGTPVQGKMVEFLVTPRDLSGGHNHIEARPTGTIDIPACVTGENGSCTVFYSAGEVSGAETIVAKISESPLVTASKDIEIAVVGLSEVVASAFYRLTGKTEGHPDNHYMRSDLHEKLSKFGSKYMIARGVRLGFNDMSLKSGGLFDIGPTSQKSWEFWAAPHKSHRVGTSLDIDSCAPIGTFPGYSYFRGNCPAGFVEIEDILLERLCRHAGGKIIPEATNHCEF